METKPSNPRADALPTTGYAVAVDGKIKSEYASVDEALKAGSKIKQNFPLVHVTIYDAEKKTRTPVDNPEADSKKT